MTPDQKNPTASQSGRIPRRVSLDPAPYCFNHPPAGLTGFLRLIWPLIFV
ncbi:MAG: hypothetical protein KJ833_05170 [Alphaproteobacteria bacterium]|nr:hypothetical protein [Hyphomonas sp.]MBU3919390.1 hypothetical protein [Alphaproteobacteria bacterium]MBU4062976.1 hypothetical protein [Alphaproteobacteria bacterium]MBU4165508.1 hypothetical protein [Alphaproteobacteria bacterium]MBU4568337.1 hypothetical protein [Alphaproteobacteria bacterium]